MVFLATAQNYCSEGQGENFDCRRRYACCHDDDVLLARAGIETEAATTGRKALQMAADGHFDLITLEVDLPDVSGYEVCRLLRENPFFQTPIVFVSGRPLEQDIRRGFELGAVDYIAKPFETFEFAPRLLFHVRREKMAAQPR